MTGREVEPRFKEFGPTVKRRRPLPHRSARKADTDRVLAEAVAVVKARSGGRCEMPGVHADGCNGWGVEAHHIVPRSLIRARAAVVMDQQHQQARGT